MGTGEDCAGVPTLLGAMVYVQCCLDILLVDSGPQLWVWVPPWSLQQLSVLLLRCQGFAGNLFRTGYCYSSEPATAGPCSGPYREGAGTQSTPCCACSCAKLKSLAGLQKFKVLDMDSLINATASEDWDVFNSNSFFPSSPFNFIVTGLLQ